MNLILTMRCSKLREEFLWVEKYRPSTIDECVLPEGLRKTFLEFVDKKEIPNLLLAGSAGIGKTTVARALCEQLDTDYVLINGSESGGIDTLRTKIKSFASTVSLSGGTKVVILDEADYLNPQSTQPALRGFIEEFSGNCRFIFTCNFSNRIISPLHSRCSVVEFKIPKVELPKVATEFATRLQGILEKEQVGYNKDILNSLIGKYFPDWRRILNECQRYGMSGTIDIGILTDYSDAHLNVLYTLLKNKEFTKMRQWVVDNLDNDPTLLYRKIYNSLVNSMKPESIPDAVLIIADYSYKSAFVADQEINLVSCLTELMLKCEIL